MVDLRDILEAARHLNEEEKQVISKAYHFALQIHEGSLRLFSKERIDAHITRLGLILARLGMGGGVIAAGLLHHSLREGAVSRKLAAEFGETVARLVEGATKLSDLKYPPDVRHIESFRKLFVASAMDIRILILKLVDRLDSVRSFPELQQERRYQMARETMEIYVPLARRLGFQEMSREMEDLAFQYIEPEQYRELQKWLKKKQLERAHSIEKFQKSLWKQFAKADIRNVETDTRRKGVYSIYEKVHFYKKELEDIHDVLAIRVQVDTVEDCYRVLGIIHGKWRRTSRKNKDTSPSQKPNGYQGFIRRCLPETGALLKYKSVRGKCMSGRVRHCFSFFLQRAKKNANDPYYSWLNKFLPSDSTNEKEEPFAYVPKWLRRIIHGDRMSGSENDHMTSLKSDFFQDRMFIFDQRGEVIDLPLHATPVDFAYELDAERANHLHGTKVNGKMVPISTELKSGDIVEIITKDSAHPTEKWHSYAKTMLAKNMIRRYLDSLPDNPMIEQS